MASNQSEGEPSRSETTVGAAFTQAGMGALWQSGAASRARQLGMATELMLDLAGVTTGSRVLDIAAGTGEQTIVAARRAGPSGQVLATDIAPGMLEVAAEEVRKAGLGNVETRVMDAQSLELEDASFDAVISRLGVMLVPDSRKALAEIRRVLKPGGKLGMIVFSTPERNLGVLLPSLIARRHAGLPALATGQEGMFSLGRPGLLEQVLGEIGFRDVQVRAVSAPRQYASTAEMLAYMTGSTPMLREPMARLDEAGRAATLGEIEETMRQFEGPDGIQISGEILVGAGTR
jgi:ubiquinone/menaquinone biosynthesis C-methylase UbiE